MTDDPPSTPLLFEKRGLNEDIDLPDELLGLYDVYNRSGDEGTKYDLVAMLTSKGWIPPVETREVVLMKSNTENGVIDMDVFSNRTTSTNVIVRNPIELRETVSDENITHTNISNPASLDPRWDKGEVEYYVPDVGTKQKAKYIRDPIRQLMNINGEMEYEELKEIFKDKWEMNIRVLEYLTGFKYSEKTKLK